MSERIKLKGITWNHPRGLDCLIAASNEYAKQTDVDIEWKVRTLQEFADASISELAKKYDFIILDHPHVGQVALNGCLLPLPDNADLANNSIGGSHESYIYNGISWAYAVDAACQVAVYRPDLKLPIPKQWKDFFASDARSYKSITPLKPVDAFDALLTLLASLNETFPAAQGVFFDPQKTASCLSLLRRLYQLSPPEAVDWNPIDVLDLLSTTNDFAYSPCLFGYVNYIRPGFRDNTLSYLDLPTFDNSNIRRSILGGAGVAVSAQTSHPDDAIKFATWISSEPIQSSIYLQNEGQPAHLGSWNKLKTDKLYHHFFNGVYNTMSNAWTRPRDEWFLGFVDDVCLIFPDFFRNNIECDTFVAHLNSLYLKHYK
ncbi:ABC transporter substrate-binding protein [Marinomonas sp. 15G1-11]|uniref:ABC transporter substrate-binding protein n=1 Tax=Marinomonas phaeophyticola TaxID=3004091 RepID=A0ABT4JXK2_9GAMM|nr:ABC transporter substrate-binding protein [Marinomonas sp. 15G1-11]MCZ2722955.1 ABC transporter substrate-binding protein [Marinomonas sp. 15G1-11]